MKDFSYDPTNLVVFGSGTLQELGEMTRQLGGRRILLVTDEGIVAAGHAQCALDSLSAASLTPFLFRDVLENPTTGVVEQGVEFARSCAGIDFIVGLGGGSSMDCAKGINFLLTNGGRMEDYWGYGKARSPLLPSIGIPTTAGTGSEAQSYALITQQESRIKMACGDKKARFRAVILDPDLTASMPSDVAAVTAMDAVSHALESYVTTRRNPVSQMFAREAWRMLNRHWEVALEDPMDPEARGSMLLGAHWAGAAIENSMLGAAHACANPLTAGFDITHGIAVGLMLPHVIRLNAPVAGVSYQELLQAAGISNGNPTVGPEGLVERLDRLRELARLPHRLRDCRVNRQSLPELASQAAKEWTGTFNPQPLSQEILIELYEKAY